MEEPEITEISPLLSPEPRAEANPTPYTRGAFVQADPAAFKHAVQTAAAAAAYFAAAASSSSSLPPPASSNRPKKSSLELHHPEILNFPSRPLSPVKSHPQTSQMERAALSLAAAAVSPVIMKLRHVGASHFRDYITRDQLNRLQTIILPKIQAVVDSAEKVDAATLKPWLMALQTATYEAEDALDLYEYKGIKNRLNPPSSNNPLKKINDPLKKIKSKTRESFPPLLPNSRLKKSFEKLKKSANEADKLLIPLVGLASSSTPHDMTGQRPTNVSGLSTPVFGRDRERDDLVNMLLKDPHESSSSRRNDIVHVIHGIGGAGKTTLAQYVYDDKRVGDHFDLKIWICVTHTFDIHGITEEIIRSVGNTDSLPVGNLSALHKRLQEDLKSRKLLLVLDDVCIEEKDRHSWYHLVTSLTKGGAVESKILITTRMEETAQNLGVKSENVVPLSELKTEECWFILKYYAFGNADEEIEDRLLADVGKKILHKLKNSPLAARLVGCLLGKNVCLNAWRMVLNTDMLGESLDVILLSFQHLPIHLRRCFAICSLYQRGYSYSHSAIDILVQLWIAHGYVEATWDETLEEKGRQYFDDLVSYSLFQSDSRGDGCYVMHDLVHDVAEKVSKAYCFRIEGDGFVDIPSSVIHLSVVRGKLCMHMPEILKLANLRTFLIFPSNEVEFEKSTEHTTQMFKKCTKLRVLRFGRCSVPELDYSVGNLKHLRDLQLKQVKELPESLFTLYQLQFLYLEGESVDKLVKSLKRLEKLRYLSLPRNAYSRIEDIGKLICLQKLEVYDVISYGGLEQLRNLQELRGRLRIKGLENVKNKTEAVTANLNAKRHLKEVQLRWGSSRDADPKDEVIMESLEPPPNVQRIHIDGYKGAEFPSWMWILNNLTSLVLQNCPNLREILNDQDCLPNLASFHLWSCPSLTSLPHLSGCLKVLIIGNCPGLIQMSSFPFGLEHLSMNTCPGAEAFLSSAISSTYESDDPKNQELQSARGSSHQPSSRLKSLQIYNCSGLQEKTLNGLLMNERFSSLSSVELDDVQSMTSLCLGPHLTALESLLINDLKNLSSIQDMRSVRSFKNLRVCRCPRLTTVGGGRENITDCGFSSIKGQLIIEEPLMLHVLLQQEGLNSLKELSIWKSSQDVPFTAEQEDVFSHLTSLRHLVFWGCMDIPSLPATLESLPFLERLSISWCRRLKSLPNLPPPLKSLSIQCCNPCLKEKYKVGGPLRQEIDRIPDIKIY